MKVASREWLSKPGFDTHDYEYHGEFEASLLHGWLTRVRIQSIIRFGRC
jgi:hypothetical protein